MINLYFNEQSPNNFVKYFRTLMTYYGTLCY